MASLDHFKLSKPDSPKHASPKKHRVVRNFLSFYSVILKLGTKKELVIL